jgi:CubicO group peptidase (beta-lactamase class C family)
MKKAGLVLLVLFSAVARADELDAQARAAYDAKEFSRSADLYERLLGETADAGAAYDAARAAALAGQRDRALRLLERYLASAGQAGTLTRWFMEDSDLDSLRKDPRYVRMAAEARAQAEKAIRPRVGVGLMPTTARAAGLDPAAVERLLAEAGTSRTSALVLLVDGKVAGEWYFGGWTTRIETMSVTKSVVSLAIGFLVDDGKLTLDTPLATFYPELAQGRKERITVRHVLNHTSGIAADPVATRMERSPDFVRFALAAEMDAAPGERFFYNNTAVNLLAGVVERASGEKLDDFLRERLFAPLGITEVTWWRDRSGNPAANAGLQIHALDLAKIGQLVLDEGMWRGRRILSAEWIRRSAWTPGQRIDPTCALLWWLSYPRVTTELPKGLAREAAARGLEPALAARLEPLEGRTFAGLELRNTLHALAPDRALFYELEDRGLLPPPRVAGTPAATSAQGYGGQRLIVVPGTRIVAVRMSIVTGEPDIVQSFAELDDLVVALKRR